MLNEFRENRIKNTTCDLSDWDAATLSFQPFASDTIEATTFTIYSRHGRYPNEPLDERRCTRLKDGSNSNSSASTGNKRPAIQRPVVVPSSIDYQPATSFSEDGTT